MRPEQANVPGPALKSLAMSSWEAITEDKEIGFIIMLFFFFNSKFLFYFSIYFKILKQLTRFPHSKLRQSRQYGPFIHAKRSFGDLFSYYILNDH